MESERWQVVAPESQERHLMGDENNNGFDLEKSFFSADLHFDVWGTLGRPVVPTVQLKEDVLRECDEEDNEEEGDDYYPWRMSLGMLDLLSNEIVDMVVGYVDDSDLVALGLTCRGFWNLIVLEVQSRYIKRAAPWAGKKIALQGSHSKVLPPSFEENGLAKKTMNDLGGSGTGEQAARDFFFSMEANGTAPRTQITREAVFLSCFESHFPSSMVPEWRSKDMREELKSPDLFPADRDWVLRNLTTREYVSDTSWWGCIRISKIRLVDALLTQILWSVNQLDPGPEAWKEWHRGAWAGHCFDVVTKEVMMSEGGAEMWKDATSKVQGRGRMFGYYGMPNVIRF